MPVRTKVKEGLINKPTRYLVMSQVVFFSSITICALLKPDVVSTNLGISYFGNYKVSLLPYTIGLLSSGYLIIKAGNALPRTDKTFKTLSEALYILAILIIGVCLTPYSLNEAINWLHIGASSLVFTAELALALWLVARQKHDITNIGLLIIQSSGALIALFSLIDTVELMFTAQLITQLAFGMLLIRTIYGLTTGDKIKT